LVGFAPAFVCGLATFGANIAAPLVEVDMVKRSALPQSQAGSQLVASVVTAPLGHVNLFGARITRRLGGVSYGLNIAATPQISAQTWNVCVLEAQCSAAVT
jgi:hypothetical protein